MSTSDVSEVMLSAEGDQVQPGMESEEEIMRDELETLKAEQVYDEFKISVSQESVDITELKAIAAASALTDVGGEGVDDTQDPEWNPHDDIKDEEDGQVENVEEEAEKVEVELSEDQEDEDGSSDTDLSDVDETEDEAVGNELADKGRLSDVKIPVVMQKEFGKRFPAMWRTGRNLVRVSAEEVALEVAADAGVDLPDEVDLDPDFKPDEAEVAKIDQKEGEMIKEIDTEDEEFAANNPLDPNEVSAEAAILADLETDESKMDEDLNTMIKALEIADKEEGMSEDKDNEQVVVLADAITSFDESSYEESKDLDYVPPVVGKPVDVSDSSSDSDEDKMEESDGCAVEEEEAMDDK